MIGVLCGCVISAGRGWLVTYNVRLSPDVFVPSLSRRHLGMSTHLTGLGSRYRPIRQTSELPASTPHEALLPKAKDYHRPSRSQGSQWIEASEAGRMDEAYAGDEKDTVGEEEVHEEEGDPCTVQGDHGMDGEDGFGRRQADRSRGEACS